MIEILAGTLIETHEVAGADLFSDEVYGNDLRRVENFSNHPPNNKRCPQASGFPECDTLTALRKLERLALPSPGALGWGLSLSHLFFPRC